MTNYFKYYSRLQKEFKFSSPVELASLVFGGVLQSVFELFSVSALIPMVLLIMDPETAVNGRILGGLYRLSGVQSITGFTMLLAALVIFILLVKVVFNIVLWKYEFRILNKWRVQITSSVFDNILYADYETIHREDSSSIINLISSTIPYIITNYIHNLIVLVQMVTLMVIFTLFTILISPFVLISSMVFGFMMISAFVIYKRRKVKSLGKESQEISKEVFSVLQMAIFGFKETKINLKEKFFSNLFTKTSQKSASTELSLQFIQSLPGMIIEFISLTTILLAFITVLYVSNDIKSAAIKVSILIFVGMRFIPLINRSITSITMIYSAFEPIEKLLSIYNILTSKKELVEYPNVEPLGFNGEIKFDNVAFKYATQKKTLSLNHINMTINKGDHIGVVGASGAGKTTFINIILGFLTNYTGIYSIDGAPIRDNSILALRKILSFVDQHPFLLNNTYIANVAFGDEQGEVDMDRVVSSLKLVGLLEHVLSSEKGLDTVVGENGKFLSGGQRQRLAIARALYKNAQILILDEASSALDMDSEAEIASLLDRLKGKITIISIAHRLSTLKNCDRLFFFEGGEIIDKGKFGKLYQTNETFRRYVDHSNIQVTQDEIYSC